MSWTIKLNGAQFDRWESFSFARAIRGNVGKFTIEASDKAPKDSPLHGNDNVQFFYKDQTAYTGVVDSLKIHGARNGSRITYEGRDPLCDVVDSSLPDGAKNIKGELSLVSVISKVFKELGVKIKIIDSTAGKVGTKKVKLQKTGESGSSSMEYLAKMAAAMQVWLVSNERGELVIFRAGEEKSSMQMVYLNDGDGKNNILDASLNIDLTQVFSKIKVRGKGSISFDVSKDSASGLVDINGEHYDQWARPSRYLEIKSDEIKTRAQAAQRAKDEVNLRRAKAFEYVALTNIFTDKQGKIIRLGQAVEIEDEARQVSGRHIISAIDVSFDKGSGTAVKIAFAPAEAYQIVEIDARQEKCGKTKKHIKKQEKSKVK